MATENGDNNSDDHHGLKTCLVLGGRGFVGRVLVERLLRLGNWIVRIADYTQSPQLEPSELLLSEAFSSRRASYFHVDVRNKPQIIKAMGGVSAVFYTESIASFPRDFFSCYTIIVQGAKNVVKACRECKVKHLIYNSSADVVFDGSRNLCNGDESLPYPSNFENMVTDLKSQAEALILFANEVDGLLTCALRPCNVFGPGDNQLMPSLVNMAHSSWTKFIIGSSENMSDFTYVDNVAHAHICAEESLSSQMVSASGKVFFITNLEPMKVRDFVPLVLESFGYQRPIFNLPAWVIRYFCLLVKLMHLKLNSEKIERCMLIYDVAKLVSHTRTFSCSAAETHLGYSPIVSLEEGAALTVDSFSALAKDSPLRRYNDPDEPSKVDKLLGGGKVADILLWRDEKKTFICFLLLVLLYYWFFLSGRTFITSAAKLLLMIIVSLYGYRMLPANIRRFTFPRVSSTCCEVSKVDMRNSFLAMTCMWNELSLVTRLLARGEDWRTFLKVSAFLYLCKLIVPHFLTVAIGIALVLAFTLFFVYEQYEEDIDGMAKVAISSLRKTMISSARNLPMSLTSVLLNCEPLKEKKSS
ncbi:3beta-hydroxysteroid-dehydrogenase/decarboxylase isoform 3 [Forsythia ovata]|uniref:Reticulon-like protein n=1 Tax=Forsythia ovata TaxID=205694 RepID=A0ABD1PHQ4_9LAMI